MTWLSVKAYDPNWITHENYCDRHVWIEQAFIKESLIGHRTTDQWGWATLIHHVYFQKILPNFFETILGACKVWKYMYNKVAFSNIHTINVRGYPSDLLDVMIFCYTGQKLTSTSRCWDINKILTTCHVRELEGGLFFAPWSYHKRWYWAVSSVFSKALVRRKIDIPC